MNALVFEYRGHHFTPYMKLAGGTASFIYMANNMNHKSALFSDNEFSYDDFYDASPIAECDLFKCVENGRIYIPTFNLLEYTGELHGTNPVFILKKKRPQ